MLDQLSEAVLFPAIEPYQSGMLPVDPLHTLYWEQCGNPNGVPVLFLHGGPGGGVTPTHRRFFDPAYYRIVLFDQRGAGKSTPLGEYRNNTTPLLVEDIEVLRRTLGIEQWLVFGGSWGSTLALGLWRGAPERCTGFVLRGIFLCTAAEIDWFINGMKLFYPEVHAEFAAAIPPEERGDLLHAYEKRLFSANPEVYLPAARAWARYEGSCLYLLPHPGGIGRIHNRRGSFGTGPAGSALMLNRGFFTDDQLIRDIGHIRHLPAVIVQGRYDVICPPHIAYRLHDAWPEARFHLIADAGHAAAEAGTAAALVAATEQFKQGGAFE